MGLAVVYGIVTSHGALLPNTQRMPGTCFLKTPRSLILSSLTRPCPT